MTDKTSKHIVRYRQGSGNRRCGKCTMWKPPAACTAVAGIIDKDYLCDLFKVRQEPADKIAAELKRD